MNEAQGLWVAITILAGACGAGYLFLIKKIDENRARFEGLETGIQSRPDFKYVHDEFVRKEVNDLQFRQIERDLKDIKDAIKGMKKDD